MSREHTVEIWGKRQVISVHQQSKSVWIAVGDYMGLPIEGKGSTESVAVAHWRDRARYKGN